MVPASHSEHQTDFIHPLFKEEARRRVADEIVIPQTGKGPWHLLDARAFLYAGAGSKASTCTSLRGAVLYVSAALWSVSMLISRITHGLNRPQPPLTERQHEGSLLIVALATIETRGTIWARRVLSAVAVITAVAAVAGCWNRGPSISGLL